jgi:diguanylate cyclase (GGDEF)-like protein
VANVCASRPGAEPSIRPVILCATALSTTAVAVALGYGGRVTAAMLAVFAAALSCIQGARLARLLIGQVTRERRLSSLHLKTIEALALAIDAKDKTASSHIRRVQWYARALATAVGLPSDEIQGVVTAALLHDIGKLAIPEHILSKPGRLTSEEFEKIQIHPQVGYEIIEHVPFPYPVAPLVLCHHERFDGKGYPLGLCGEDIPVGARVLAVADHFDSLTRRRPYHEPIPRELALITLRQEAGKALDPALVATFIELLPTLQDEPTSDAWDQPGLDDVARNAAPAGGLAELPAFENIARAHQEIYALYEIAQAIGKSLGVADTMTLIADKLEALVPFACCALFVAEDDHVLRCRFAQGTDADNIRRLALRPGRGSAGWVTRNRRTLVNARPSADFDGGEFGLPPQHLRSALVCALVSGDRVVGTLSLYHTEADFYTDEHRRLLDRIAEQAAAAIGNSIVFEQTREASLSDALTGLPNTRYMFNYLNRELSRSQRLGTQVAILVLDLDDFKTINDSFGHHVGDRALREVARVLRETIRPYDLCVRYAGDEFIVVLSDCGPDEAEARRLELQRAIEVTIFEGADGHRIPLRLSIGGAVFPDDGDSYEALLATADGRMYRDKKLRKHRPGVPTRSSVPRLEPRPLRIDDEQALVTHGFPGAVS